MQNFNELMKERRLLVAEFRKLIKQLHEEQKALSDYNFKARERLNQMAAYTNAENDLSKTQISGLPQSLANAASPDR